MYHFIRRCFVLVLVLAFGFSFLLCCFGHTCYSQFPMWSGYFGGVDGVSSHGLFEGGKAGHVATWQDELAAMRANTYLWWEGGSLGFNQFQLGGWNSSSVLMDTQSISPRSLWSVSPTTLMDQTGFMLGTALQQYNHNLVLSSYTNGRSVTGDYGYPSAGTVNYSLPYSVSSVQTYGTIHALSPQLTYYPMAGGQGSSSLGDVTSNREFYYGQELINPQCVQGAFCMPIWK